MELLRVGSDQHRLDGAAQRWWQAGPAAKTNNQIRSTLAKAKKTGEPRPLGRHFNGLVEVRIANSQGGCLEGESLVTAPDVDPAGRAGVIRDKNGDSG